MLAQKPLQSALFALAAFGAQAASRGALAGDTSGVGIILTGVAPSTCRVDSLSASGGATNGTYGANRIILKDALDPSTGLFNESAITLDANAMCNFGVRISVSSQNGGLTPSQALVAASGSAGYAAVPYKVHASWGPVKLLLDTGTGGKVAEVVTGGANSGRLSLSFGIPRSHLPVAPGPYRDVVTVKIGVPL